MNTRLSTSEGNEFESSIANRSNSGFLEWFDKQVVSSKTIGDNTQTNTPIKKTSYEDSLTLNNMTNLSTNINTSSDKGTRGYKKLLTLK